MHTASVSAIRRVVLFRWAKAMLSACADAIWVNYLLLLIVRGLCSRDRNIKEAGQQSRCSPASHFHPRLGARTASAAAARPRGAVWVGPLCSLSALICDTDQLLLTVIVVRGFCRCCCCVPKYAGAFDDPRAVGSRQFEPRQMKKFLSRHPAVVK